MIHGYDAVDLDILWQILKQDLPCLISELEKIVNQEAEELNMAETTKLIYKYLRHDKKFPHVWCPACGNGIVLGALIRAIDRSGYDKDDIVLISAIAAAGRMPVYVDFNTLHTTHGRALTFATGVKLAKPSLQVIVIMGDGDATAIGGNHFIHAARRIFNLTAIIVNNNTYGMTGGQYSPTSPYGSLAAIRPYMAISSILFPLRELAVTAGAAFVGRSTVFHANILDQLIETGIKKRGFAVIEAVSHCHTLYGRKNKLGGPVEMLQLQKDAAVRVEKAQKMTPEELTGKITIGTLIDRDLPVYTEELERIRQAAKTRAAAVSE